MEEATSPPACNNGEERKVEVKGNNSYRYRPRLDACCKLFERESFNI